MSNPQRYTLALPDISYGMDESSKGEYVLWRDYAKLKAEVERLRASSFVTAVPVEQYERLLKAGDALASALILFEMKSEEERQGKIKAWSAAKEGKPSV